MSNDKNNPFDDLLKDIEGVNENTKPEISQILNLDAIVDSLQHEEKRGEPRVPFDAELRIFDHVYQQVLKAKTVNISKHGMCVYVDNYKFKPDEPYKLQFKNLVQGQEISFEGKIVRMLAQEGAKYKILGFYIKDMPAELLALIG